MIFAVIITYNPNVENVSRLINSLALSNVTPVIVDNHSNNSFALDCKTIHLEENFGIAKAQNVGINFAESEGASHIIFFDQDSVINNTLISELLKPIQENKTHISAPIFIDEKKGFTYPIVHINKNGTREKIRPTPDMPAFKVNNVISSGTLVAIEVIQKVGLMKESFFIDYVDTEWCLRANSLGYNILVIPSAVMLHSIGDKTLTIGKYHVPKHSPFRRYYRIRNSFYLLKYPYIPKLMASREIIFSIIHQCILIAFSTNERKAYFTTLCKGLIDGLKGLMKHEK